MVSSQRAPSFPAPSDNPRMARIALCLLLLQTIATPAFAAVDYAREIKPLLASACVQCHGAAQPKGGLRLDTAEAARAGGDSGKALLPGKSGESLMIRLLSGAHEDIPQMPYKRNPLASEHASLLSRWIDEGATGPENEEPSVWTHWAFVAPKRPALPTPATRAAHPVDALLQPSLEAKGIRPSPRAEKETLLRRVHLDLTGLPPSPTEADAFLQDAAPDAFEKVVDRLLQSPHYGERWGRWWLDQARYADSNGYSIDAPRSIWPYRDWVVNALNADMPFDTFSIEQLAGDLLPEPTLEQRVATGFHRNTQINGEGGIDPEQFRVEAVFDRVATTGSVWLGLTLNCCQCHDHKFDPLSQKEYFGMFAFFNTQEQDGHGGSKNPTIALPKNGVDPETLALERKKLETEIRALLPGRLEAIRLWEKGLTSDGIKKLLPEVQKTLRVPAAKRSPAHHRILYAQFAFNDAEFKGVNDRLKEIESEEAARTTTLVMQEMTPARTTQLFIKGDFTRPAEPVHAATPSVLPPLEKDAPRNRLTLARWLVGKQNPLTARVVMNRVWLQYFGRGLVETENDFGTQGTPPTHPELLDLLAVEFMERGWSLKAMHRFIVTSEAYQRSSVARSDLALLDPYNKLLSHQNRLRLDAELIRDVSLAATGLLSSKLGGPPVYPPQPEGAMMVGQVRRPWPASTGADRYRRALYTFLFRASPHPALTVFDAPDAFTTCTRRNRSNTPLQALTLLNDPAYAEFAEAMRRVIEEKGIEEAFRRCVTRRPTEKEKTVLAALTPMNAARVLLNLDETITRE
jgi:hypothetical protein